MTKSVSLLCLSVLLCSCSTLIDSPSQNFDEIFTERQVERLNAKFTSADWRSLYNSLPDGPEKFKERNKLIEELIWLCDQDFERYIDAAYKSRTWFNIVTDVLVFGASSAAVVASPGAQTALAGIAAGASGFRGIINSELYGNETRDAVIVTMRAIRQGARADMYESLADSTDELSLDAALMEVSWYSRQGNVRDAVMQITIQGKTEALNQSLRAKNARLHLAR